MDGNGRRTPSSCHASRQQQQLVGNVRRGKQAANAGTKRQRRQASVMVA